MELGVCIASHIGDVDYAVEAEALGYSHAWFADSQMLWSDCYATLALAADRLFQTEGHDLSEAGRAPDSQ